MPVLDREVRLQMVHRSQRADAKGKEKVLISSTTTHGSILRADLDVPPEPPLASGRRREHVP
jgi:hypothetical protein